MEKYGVIFSGGGAKGGYQIGVWKALNELGFVPDVVTGTSVGALNGALLAMGEYKKALSIWENMSMSTVFEQFTGDENTSSGKMDDLFSRVLKEAIFKRGADYTPLQNLVRSTLDEKKLRSAKAEFGLVTTKFSPIKAVELFIEDIPEGMAADYIIASAACFPVMKSYKIGDSVFVDGGYSDNIPVKMALDKGATEIVAVNIGSMGKAQNVETGSAVVHYIQNKRPFNNGQRGSVMMFDKNISLQNIQLGYLDGLKEFGKLDGFYYSFHKGEAEKALFLEPVMRKKYRTVFSDLPASSKLEEAASESVKKHLGENTEFPLGINCGALACIEAAAEIFEINPRIIYTVDTICEMVEERFYEALNNQSADELISLAKTLDRGISFELMKTAVSGLDKKALTVYAAQILMHAEISHSHMLRLWIIAALMPDVFCAAMFCYAYLQITSD